MNMRIQFGLLLLCVVACSDDEGAIDDNRPSFGKATLESPPDPQDPEPPRFSDCPLGWTAKRVTVEPEIFDPRRLPPDTDVAAVVTNSDDSAPASLIPEVDLSTATQAIDCIPNFEPEVPELWPEGCPDGWVEDGFEAYGEFFKTCAPPMTRTLECAAGSRPGLANGGCVPLGPQCSDAPPESWAAAGRTLFVRAGATGNGSYEDPVGSITEAIELADSGWTIRVFSGTYAEDLLIGKELQIEGECTAGVEIIGSPSTVTAVAEAPETIPGAIEVLAGGDLQLHNVTIRGERTGLRVHEGALDAVNVHLDSVTRTGAHVSYGTMHLENVWVSDTQDDGTDARGRGIQYEFDSEGSIVDVTVDRARRQGLVVITNSRVEADNLFVRDTQTVQGLVGQGAAVGYGGTLTLRSSFFQGNHGYGVYAEEEGTLRVVESVVYDTLPDETGIGAGVGVNVSASASIERSAVAGNAHGMVSSGELNVESSTISSNGEGGIFFEGVVSVANSVIEDNGYFGIIALEAGELLVEDSVVFGNAEPINAPSGDASSSQVRLQGSTGTLRRVRIASGGTSAGLAVFAGASAELEEVVIRDQMGSGRYTQRRWGYGLTVQQGATATLSRVHVEQSTVGIAVYGSGSSVAGSQVVVEDTTGQELDGALGYGLMIADAAAELRDAVIDGSTSAAVILSGQSARLLAEDLIVRDTQPWGATGASAYGYGLGVYVTGEASASFRRALIERNRMVGILIGNGGQVSAEHLEVSGTLPPLIGQQQGLGVVVQGEGEFHAAQALFDHNHGYGVAASGPEAYVTLDRSVIRDTVPGRLGFYGVGVAASSRGSAILTRSRVENSVLAGAHANSGGGVRLEDTEVDGVGTGYLSYRTFLDSEVLDDVGDCVLATVRSVVELERVRVGNCARSGVTFDDSEGTITDLLSTGSHYGLTVQGFPVPTIDHATVELSGNRRQFADQRDLPVPEAAPEGFASDELFGNLIGDEPP